MFIKLMQLEKFIKSIEYGVCDQLTPLVRRVIANNPGGFTFTGTGTYIIGNKNIAVIDPGPIDNDHYNAIMKATSEQKITHILLTHNHNDHSPLAKKLKSETGAKIYYKNLSNVELAQDDFEEGYDRNIEGDIELKDGDKIETDEWSIEAIHTPGHTSNHICYALLDENILFSGDHVMGWSTTVIVPPDGNMDDYIISLEKLLSRREEKFFPTHGPVIDEPKKLVSYYISHRLNREKQIIDAIKKGNNKISEIVKMIYKDVDKSLHPAAAMSTLAHLKRMENNQEVTVKGKDLEGIYNIA